MCIKLDRCCCFDLKTGVIIIGVYGLVCNILALIGENVAYISSAHFMGSQQVATAFLILGVIAAVLLLVGVRNVSNSEANINR